MIPRILFLIPLTFFMLACEQEQELPEPGEDIPVFDRLIAVIHPTDGNETSGVVTFSREGEDVRVIATVSGLEPESQHGFHIHEYGDCSDDEALSAGTHFDPFGMEHGGPTDDIRHMGDMGNLVSDEDGTATIEYVDHIIEMDGPYSIVGRGVVVHEGADDLESQPVGDAGARIGCGVIGIAQPIE